MRFFSLFGSALFAALVGGADAAALTPSFELSPGGSAIVCSENSGPGGGGGGGDWEPDFDWSDHDDADNSGPGGGDNDWDNDFDWPDNDPGDNSGPGGGDWEDNDHADNSGPGGGDGEDNDHADNSGPGSSSNHEPEGEPRQSLTSDVVFAVGHDEFGREFVRDEILYAASERDVVAARALGFEILSQTQLSSGGRLVRFARPRGMSMRAALRALRNLSPTAIAAPNYIYRESQAAIGASTPARPRAPRQFAGVVGVIDTGVDGRALPPGALLSHSAFAGPQPIPGRHGSIVAAIVAENGAQVHAADVFGRTAEGRLAAAADSIVRALDWMLAHNVAVINISIEGPDNAVLREMVRRAVARGHIIVAAAGNGGPAAYPAFPAAFEDVVGVTAIDAEGRPYLRANRGEYIDFAALGVNLRVRTETEEIVVSGTSFAAPQVAANIAARLRAPSLGRASGIVAQLRAEAGDLGAPGRDPIFGWGALRF